MCYNQRGVCLFFFFFRRVAALSFGSEVLHAVDIKTLQRTMFAAVEPTPVSSMTSDVDKVAFLSRLHTIRNSCHRHPPPHTAGTHALFTSLLIIQPPSPKRKRLAYTILRVPSPFSHRPALPLPSNPNTRDMHERIARRQEQSKAFMEQPLEEQAKQTMRRLGVRLPESRNDLGGRIDDEDEDDDDDFGMGPGGGDDGGGGGGGGGAGRRGAGGGGGGGRGGYSDDDIGDGVGVVDPEVGACFESYVFLICFWCSVENCCCCLFGWVQCIVCTLWCMFAPVFFEGAHVPFWCKKWFRHPSR